MQTGIGPEIQAKLTASKGGQDITAPVRNGEVISYNIEVRNTGSEDMNNISVKANVPEGTIFVRPEENYEYTGASYYKEFDYKTFEGLIQTLRVGEVVNISYEVRVKNDTEAGTELKNQAEIKYGEVTKQTEEVKNSVSKGNIRVTVKRITDKNVNLYKSGVVQYFAIIENISNEKQENLKVRTNLSEGLEVNRVMLTTNMQVEEGEIFDTNNQEGNQNGQVGNTDVIEIDEKDIPKTEEITYSKEMNIGDLEPGQNKVISYDLTINEVQNDAPIEFSVEVVEGKEQYQSNRWQDNVRNIDVNLSMTTNTQNEYVHSGDIIKYTISVENKTDAETNLLEIQDNIPMALTINKVTLDGKEVRRNKFK